MEQCLRSLTLFLFFQTESQCKVGLATVSFATKATAQAFSSAFTRKNSAHASGSSPLHICVTGAFTTRWRPNFAANR